MSRRKKTEPADSGRKSGSRQLAVVVPILAAVVVAATAYHLYTRREPRTRQNQHERDSELAESVRARLEDALAVAEATADNPAVQEIRRELLTRRVKEAASYILTEDPADVIVRPMLARVLLELAQPEDAEHVVDDLLRFAPDSAEGLWLKGVVGRRLGKPGYMAFLRRAAESPRAYGQIWASYGRALLDENRHEEAKPYLVRAIRARRQGRELTAKDAEILHGLGVIEMKGGRFAQAAEYLTEAAGLVPNSLGFVLKLIEAQRRAGEGEAAGRTVVDALERFNRWADRAALWMEMGVIRREQAKWLDAGEAFARAAGHGEFGTDAAFEAAKCYYNAGKYAMAMVHIDAVLEARPDDPETREWARKIEDARFPRRR